MAREAAAAAEPPAAAAAGAAPAAAAAGAAPVQPSALVDRVLELWSWGEISAVTVQYLMEAAVLDGCTHPQAVSLARIGSSGRWSNNCHRDIARQFMGDIDMPATYTVSQVPCHDSRRPLEGDLLTDVDMLLPHQLFAVLAENYPRHFSSFTRGDSLSEFWDGVERVGDPHLVGHPILGRAGWKEKAVPIVLHGDGARFARRNSLELAAWAPLLARTSTWSCKFAMAAFVKSAESQATNPGTWSVLWSVLVWSLNAMFEGFHPLHDHRGNDWPIGSYGERMKGKPLTSNGYFAVVHRVVGDLEWFRGQLNLRLAPAANQPCCWCNANRSTHPFLDLRPEASWLATVRTPPVFNPSAHPIWNVRGVQLFTIMLDVMHTADLGFFTTLHRLVSLHFSL